MASTAAAESWTGTGWDFAPWAETCGAEELICFGLCNDQIGYILCENDYRFELVDADGNLLSAAFLARKGDRSAAGGWFDREPGRFPAGLRQASEMSRTYLSLMDERTLALMGGRDIKLSLFVSRKAGSGSVILERVCERLRNEGWEQLYLWTDCDCNWQWYVRHGFTLVQEDTYEPFSGEHGDYKTYIFRKGL